MRYCWRWLIGGLKMGKYFGVAVLDSGVKGTLFFDEAPAIGSDVTLWHYDSLGNPVSVTGKLVRLL
jgi:hypothetical protein